MSLSDPASSSLIAYFCPIKDGERDDAARHEFARRTGRTADVNALTPSYRASIALSAEDTAGTDDGGNITVVLHGEIYQSAENQAAWLAQRFAAHGFDWAKEIHGSFALLAADRSRDRVVVITDRLNSRRLFASQFGEGVWVSSHLIERARQPFEPDPSGVACYITNRIVCNSRTILRNVSVLKRGCIHQLTSRGFDARPYWQYELGTQTKKFAPKKAAGELQERLVAAVRRRLYDEPGVFLSLSAGYDATGLLGMLAYSLRVPGVRCFSYEHGEPSPNSDAALSKRMAESAGYGHETVESYDGNFLRHLRDNAEFGVTRALSWYCAELGAWQTVASRFAAVERPAVFVGDECLGWRKYSLRNENDVLASLQIYDWRVLSWLLPLLPTDSQAKFREGMEEDLKQLRHAARESANGNWHNAKDYLYLDQRLGNLILPWREACVPQGVAVRSPLLDNDVLDFMTQVPVKQRLNKRLYRQTITAMYPQLFAIPRSSGPLKFYLNLAREFAAHAAEVRGLIAMQRSRLDELVPPDVLVRLLSDVVEGERYDSSGGRQAIRPGVVDKLLRRTIMRVVPQSPPVPAAKPADVLMRLLLLRMALADRDS